MDKLSNDDIENTKSRYQKRFDTFGHDQKSVGWGQKGRQTERFKILADILNMNTQMQFNILDIGSGFGDLYPFLLNSGFNISGFVGYEIVPELVNQGRIAYGNDNKFQLIHDEFLMAVIPNDYIFDVAFMSGCFNFKLLSDDNYVYIEKCLRKAYELCSIGISANFLTNKVDYKEDYIFYSDPARIMDIAYGLSRRFLIDHSYFPFEFSIAIYKDQCYNKSYPVFNDQRFI